MVFIFSTLAAYGATMTDYVTLESIVWVEYILKQKKTSVYHGLVSFDQTKMKQNVPQTPDTRKLAMV